jgi:hypothetical protein
VCPKYPLTMNAFSYIASQAFGPTKNLKSK